MVSVFNNHRHRHRDRRPVIHAASAWLSATTALDAIGG
jgi:hypothetical protein